MCVNVSYLDFLRLNRHINIVEDENRGLRRKITEIVAAMQPSVKNGPDGTVRVKFSGMARLMARNICF